MSKRRLVHGRRARTARRIGVPKPIVTSTKLHCQQNQVRCGRRTCKWLDAFRYDQTWPWIWLEFRIHQQRQWRSDLECPSSLHWIPLSVYLWPDQAIEPMTIWEVRWCCQRPKSPRISPSSMAQHCPHCRSSSCTRPWMSRKECHSLDTLQILCLIRTYVRYVHEENMIGVPMRVFRNKHSHTQDHTS